ncbi:MAG: winged helix-turn-helix transcriptional regulator [Pseudooceanicola sp.]
MKPPSNTLNPRTTSAHQGTISALGAESIAQFHGPEGNCAAVSDLLSRIGDKWTVLVIAYLGEQPMRFNALRKGIGNISQKMLTSTLRNLERDGFVSRTVTPTRPPQVEYALTELGQCLKVPVSQLARWTVENRLRIEAARAAYDLRNAG